MTDEEFTAAIAAWRKEGEMAEWGERDEPEWAEIRRAMRERRNTGATEVTDDEDDVKWLRLGISLAAMAVAWFAAVRVYDDHLAAWAGGLVVLAAGAACWFAEVLA